MGETISVAMPVFNRAEWIGQTLDHIFNQTVPVDEVVLCDDGSTDDLDAALAPFRDRVTLLRIENSGPAIARKTAIEHATGDWIALCDSDDFWESHHIENFVNAHRTYPESDLYFSNFRQSDQPGITKFQQAPAGWLKDLSKCPDHQGAAYILCRHPFLQSLLEFQACFQSCLIFRKSLYTDIGGIKPYVSRWRSEDFHLTARMAARAFAVTNTEATVLINKHPDNFSSEYIRNLEGEVNILTDIMDQRLVPQSSLKIIANTIINYKRRLFRAYYWSGQYGEAVNISRRISFGHLNLRDYVRLTYSYVLSTWKRS
ncbi:glycosyltransferase family 2 protein [Marinobacter lacisalsi]|uniref:Glycosyltransferase family 2 protein n=1 Tax=Marinobacter lacisalsi TaxID=475979 RepID=A0ABV8QFU2_9GAMM